MASRGPRRPTLSEIAERTGVSVGAVSYALNGRPGVSDETRARILKVADEIGWAPSAAAKALRGDGTRTLGLVITREPETIGIEPFFMSFVAGVERAISPEGYALLLEVTADPSQVARTYRQWWSANRVDGVFVTDLELGDTRLDLLAELGLPAVVVGEPEFSMDLPAVGSGDARAAESVIEELAALGHRRIGRIVGPERFVHTRVRSEASRAAAQRLGVEIVGELSTSYGLEEGGRACEALLARGATAIVCDNDLTAVGALRAALARGYGVPGDLSIIAWDDSALCRITEPPLSALGRDISDYGTEAAKVLLEVVKTGEASSLIMSGGVLVDRGTIAPPKG